MENRLLHRHTGNQIPAGDSDDLIHFAGKNTKALPKVFRRMTPDQEVMAVPDQGNDRFVKGPSADFQETVQNHTASGKDRKLCGLAAKICDHQAFCILYVQIQPYSIGNGSLHNIYFLCFGRGMDHQIKKRLSFYFCYICRYGDNVFGSRTNCGPFLTGSAEETACL